MTTPDEEFVELTIEQLDQMPLLAPVQAVGGGIRIGPNSNLGTDDVVVTAELVVQVPTAEGPQVGLLPVLLTVEVWQHLLDTLTDTTITEEPSPEEDK